MVILSIIFFVFGLYTLISGKLPNFLYKLIFGDDAYQLSTNYARLTGVVSISYLFVVIVLFIINMILFSFEINLSMMIQILKLLYLIVILFLLAWIISNAKELEIPSETERQESYQEDPIYALKELRNSDSQEK